VVRKARQVTTLLLEQGIPVRAFVHKLDSRSDELRKRGAEVVEGDLLNPASVQAAIRNVKRAYFTYPVADGLLEAVAIFADAARNAGLELVVNNSQFQGIPGDPSFRNLRHAAAIRTPACAFPRHRVQQTHNSNRSPQSSHALMLFLTAARGRAKCFP